MSKETTNEKVANIFTKYQNPLRNLTTRGIEEMFQQARLGNDVKLQLAYHQIERTCAIFKICIDKRVSGVLEREWDIQTLEDTQEARNQKKLVERIFKDFDTRNEDGLTDLISWLALGDFRGRSVAKCFFDDDGKLFFKKLNNWHLLEVDGKFYWNPQIDECWQMNRNGSSWEMSPKCVEVPKEELTYVKSDCPIDYAGLLIYLRSLIGETKWAKLVEKSGIAQVLLTVPPGTPEDELTKWNYRAQAIFDGASGCLPNSTDVKELVASRNGDMIEKYLDRQDRVISILATGGTALTIGDVGGGLGSDLVKEQKKQFNSLVNRDCKKISNSISNSVIPRIINKYFKGQKQLVRFTYVEDDVTSADEYLEMALKCKSLGASIDLKELKKITKLPFIKDIEQEAWEVK